MDDIEIIYPNKFKYYGIRGYFSTRIGGVSKGNYAGLNLAENVEDDLNNVLQNLELWAKSIDIDLNHLYTVTQVHGSEVVIVKKDAIPSEIRKIKADALITDVKGYSIGVRTADCVPVLLSTPQDKVVAAIHAGWKGIKNRVISCTIKTLKENFGINPEILYGAVGPAIGQCCYEVGQDLIDEMKKVLPVEDIIKNINGKNFLDLLQAVQLQLSENGLNMNNIEFINMCTRCYNDYFYSYRRDGAKSGRHIAVIKCI